MVWTYISSVEDTQQPQMELEAETFNLKMIADQFIRINRSLEKMQGKIDKMEQMGDQSQHPSRLTCRPYDFYNFPRDIPLEETSKQGGAHNTFSFFG